MSGERGSGRWETSLQAWRRLPHPLRWIGVAIVGGALVIAGVVFLVLPGPGIPLIILGLVVLATEFAWAERRLAQLRNGSGKAWEATKRRLRRT